MKYRIAICDDVRADANYLCGIVETWAQKSNVAVELKTFPSAEAFLFAYAEDKLWHILLLDVEMGKMSGVELAKTVRRENKELQIVFVTGYSDYISDGYDVEALHYLVKPVSEEKLMAVLDRAVQRLIRSERALFFDAHGEAVRIPLREIRYFEVRQNYVTIHAGQEYVLKKTLGELEKELDNGFFRTGRSFVVNLSYIRKITKTEVHLSDDTAIPLPRGMYEALNRAMIRHF